MSAQRNLVASIGWGTRIADNAIIRERWSGRWADFVATVLGKVKESDDKTSAGWVCGAEFEDAHRHGDSFRARHLVSLDYDAITPAQMASILKQLKPFAHLAYTTASHTPESPRLRVWLPLSRPCSEDEYRAIGRMFAERYLGGAALAADESYRPGQYMYFPTHRPFSSFEHWEGDGAWVDVDATLGLYADWTDSKTWPAYHGGTGERSNALEKPGLIGAFNRKFTIPEAIEKFELPYELVGGRYRYIHGQGKPGARLYDDETKLHSEHNTDPARGQHHAYDLVRIHRFGKLDEGQPADTPINKHRSTAAMNDWIRAELPDVAADVRATTSDALPDEPTEQRVADTRAGDSVSAVVGSVPKAQFSCTDQSNVHRILRHFEGRLMCSTGGRFYKWAGTHWEFDDGKARDFACRLSAIVRQEATTARAKAEGALRGLDPDLLRAAAEHPKKNALGKTEAGQRAMELVAVADGLEAWARRCEAKNVQDAALGMLRDLVKMPPERLDADPWLLNCESGTIDLRTGKVRPHDPNDLITKCCPVRYDPAATAPHFEAFVKEIMEDDLARVGFVQRWYGYCATGSMREQRFLLHVGPGGNGKGTLLTAIENVLDSYAHTASLGLLTARNGDERHTTELAELRGRRLVTAHEPDDTAELRQGLIKQITGGDRLTARFMRQDNFEFSPVCKLQILTNHKPEARGTDFGFWRRVLVVYYPVRFGTPEEVAISKADRHKDGDLPEKLRAERVGIFKWLVQGAVEWCRIGLSPPAAVLAASREYQQEQDRVGQFAAERCRSKLGDWTPAAKLFGAYKVWCDDGGYRPLGINKFLAELKRVVPFFEREDRKLTEGGFRQTVRVVRGVSLVDGVELESDSLAASSATAEAVSESTPAAEGSNGSAAPRRKRAQAPDAHGVTQDAVCKSLAAVQLKKQSPQAAKDILKRFTTDRSETVAALPVERYADVIKACEDASSEENAAVVNAVPQGERSAVAEGQPWPESERLRTLMRDLDVDRDSAEALFEAGYKDRALIASAPLDALKERFGEANAAELKRRAEAAQRKEAMC